MPIGRREAGRDEDELRLEVARYRQDDGTQRGHVLGVTHWRLQIALKGDVDVETARTAAANLREREGGEKKRKL